MTTDSLIPAADSKALRAYWPALDGVRGAFTIAVVFSHSICFGGLQETFWHARPMTHFSDTDRFLANAIWPFRDAALPGMDVFFVLSSFLITGILLDTSKNEDYFLSFFARRTLRIFPLYYIALSSLILARYLVSPAHEVVEHQLYFWTYTSNVLLAHGWEGVPEPFHHYWSLAVEEQFYVAWPFVVYFLSKRAFKYVCLVAIVGAPVYRIVLYSIGEEAAVYVSTVGRLDQLAVGALLAIEYREPKGLGRLQKYARPAILIALVMIVGTGFIRGGLAEPDWLFGTIGHTVYACLGAAIVCKAVGPKSLAQMFFLCRPFRIIGKLSYAIYIFHQPLTILICKCGIDLWHLPHFVGFVLVGQLGTGIIAFGLSFGAAWVSWHIIEAPMLSLRRYVTRAYDQTSKHQ